MSDIVGSKAISLVARGGIEEWVHPRVFFTRGLSGDKEYMVVVTAGRTICNCPAGNRGVRCYHATAARLLMHSDDAMEEQRAQDRASAESDEFVRRHAS